MDIGDSKGDSSCPEVQMEDAQCGSAEDTGQQRDQTLRRNHPIFGLLNRRKNRPQLPQIRTADLPFSADNPQQGEPPNGANRTASHPVGRGVTGNGGGPLAEGAVSTEAQQAQVDAQRSLGQETERQREEVLCHNTPFLMLNFEEIASNVSQSLSGLLPDFFKKDHPPASPRPPPALPSSHPPAVPSVDPNDMQAPAPPPNSNPGSAVPSPLAANNHHSPNNASKAVEGNTTSPKSSLTSMKGGGGQTTAGVSSLLPSASARLVLKFATLIDGYNQPSFVIGPDGCTVGRGESNSVCIPTDSTMVPEAHAAIDYIPEEVAFYLRDTGQSFGAAVQIGKGLHDRQWPLKEGAAFSAGNSVLLVESVDVSTSEPNIWLSIQEGPLKGERRKILKDGAALGRATENTISIPDRELSRRHSMIVFDANLNQFFLCDIGSTNGTYMQLVGPYGKPYKLSLQDNILIGRTCFSINRFDYGLSEEIGMRRTMEDRYSIEQDLSIGQLYPLALWPQTFVAVYDGHGGPQASTYLWENLHLMVSHALAAGTEKMKKIAAAAPKDGSQQEAVQEAHSHIVREAIKKSYYETDQSFIRTSEYPQAGSTATAALILGQKIFFINVGDSRTLLCRGGKLHIATEDHKPFRQDEENRIRLAGGFVVNKRVMGELAVSRAFGDSEFKRGYNMNNEPTQGPLITCEPEITEMNLQSDDFFLLLACDGLFDVFQNEEAVQYVLQEMNAHHNAHRTCENLSRTAIERGSRDNITIILIILNEWW